MTDFAPILSALSADLDPRAIHAMMVALRDVTVSIRPPDVIIGDERRPYMRRWWIVPRNKHDFNVYLHHFLRSDDDRALHDHPWANLSCLIEGDYIEHTPNGVFHRHAGDFAWRPATERHRIELPTKTKYRISSAGRESYEDEVPVWTLFLTGPKVREWGFWCPQGWMPWQEFTAGQNEFDDQGRVIASRGGGCGDGDIAA